MHHTFDHLSIWELSHRWHDIDPNTTTPNEIPLPVQDTIRLIAYALVRCEISVCNSRGIEKKNPHDCPSLTEYCPYPIWRARREDDPAPSSNDPVPDWSPDEGDDHSLVYVPAGELTGVEIREQYYNFLENWGAAHYKLVEGLERTYENREYDKALLEAVHVNRSNILILCELKEIDLPKFWFSEDELVTIRHAISADSSADQQDQDVPKHNTIERHTGSDSFTGQQEQGALKQEAIDLLWGRLNPQQKARILCREIAKKLWEEDPQRRTTEIISNETLLEFGGGKYYQGKNTLRDWVKGVDPREKSEKAGRPRSTPEPT